LGSSWRTEIWHEHALLVQTQNCILIFGIFRNSLKNFLIFFEIFLKKCQKFSYVSVGKSLRNEILHEHALLVAASNFILRFGFFCLEICLRVLLKNSEIFLKKCQKSFLVRLGRALEAALTCFTISNLTLHTQIWIFLRRGCMNMLYYFKLKTAYSDLDFFEIRLI
jgi:hypothetical protein